MNILIIEDFAALAQRMKEALVSIGYTVDIAHDGKKGEELAFLKTYHVILLDLNLPDKDGLEILQNLRSHHVTSSIIIVSARDGIEDRVKGLDFGSDDYLMKPFQLEELRARVQAVVRRYYGKQKSTLEIEGLVIDRGARTVSLHGVAITLLAKEFDILEYLAMRYPNIVSSQELVEHLYEETFDPFSSALRVQLTRLRKKLSQGNEQQDILKTIRGKGYCLCLK